MTDAFRYEGFREVYTALKEIDPALRQALREGLAEVGAVVERDAQERFREWNADTVAQTVADSHARTAEGFKVRVRAVGLVVVEQTLPRTSGLHPEYGEEMMKKALLPAREATVSEQGTILEERVTDVLHEHGF